ncbi:MAG: hypothetical protein B7733_06135 [Myxococcales bacterium FL481]|nr:MAG: hypothetical protein B7733_06135 [Myxococcales bacterium FL481]
MDRDRMALAAERPPAWLIEDSEGKKRLDAHRWYNEMAERRHESNERSNEMILRLFEAQREWNRRHPIRAFLRRVFGWG